MRLKWLFSFIALIFVFVSTAWAGVQSEPVTVYLVPGQGSDYRLYNNLQLPDGYDTVHIHYIVPNRKETMESYARRLLPQIDTSKPFVLIGVSLGGMLCTELNDMISPRKTIIISSAKKRSELPGRYRFQKVIPIYSILPKGLIKLGARIMQPIVEPDRKRNKETFKAMLKAKDPVFLKRSIRMIIRWKREEYNDSIIHIHGTNDHTLPHKNIQYDHEIKDGSHMMMLTEGEKVSKLLSKILE